MDKMLVVVFDSESKAYEGSRALKELDAEGSIGLYGIAVLVRNPDGTLTVREGTSAAAGTLTGTAVGSLIGVLGGPIGVAAGAWAGALLGFAADLDTIGIGRDFVADIEKALPAGKAAVVAEAFEPWVTPVDTRMEALGGTVFRRARADVVEAQLEAELAADRAEMEQLRAELAESRAERKAKLQAKLDELRAKVQAKLDAAKARSEGGKREGEAKVKVLQEKAARAQANLKAKYEERIARIRDAYNERVNKAKKLAS